MNERRATLGIEIGRRGVTVVAAYIDDGTEVSSATVLYNSNKEESDADAPLTADGILSAVEEAVIACVEQAREAPGGALVAAVGFASSTGMATPLAEDGSAMSSQTGFEGVPEACIAGTSLDDEAREFAEYASRHRPEYIAKSGLQQMNHSLWSAALRCRRSNEPLFRATHTWVHVVDWLVAHATGRLATPVLPRSTSMAVAFDLYHGSWGGYPDSDYLALLEPSLSRLRRTVTGHGVPAGTGAGTLDTHVARRVGLPPGIPVASAVWSAHGAAVAEGAGPGMLVIWAPNAPDRGPDGRETAGWATGVAGQMMVVPDIEGVGGGAAGVVFPEKQALCFGLRLSSGLRRWFERTIGDAPHLDAAALVQRPPVAVSESGGTGFLGGIHDGHDAAALYHAILVDAALEIQTACATLARHELPTSFMTLCGAPAASSEALCRIAADSCGIPVRRSSLQNPGAFGAAVLAAGLAPAPVDPGGQQEAGTSGERGPMGLETAMGAMAGKVGVTYAPDESLREYYDGLMELHSRAALSLKPLFPT